MAGAAFMRLKEGADGSFLLEDGNGGQIKEIAYGRGYRFGTINPVMPSSVAAKSWSDASKDGEEGFGRIRSRCSLRALDNVHGAIPVWSSPQTCAAAPRRLGE